MNGDRLPFIRVALLFRATSRIRIEHCRRPIGQQKAEDKTMGGFSVIHMAVLGILAIVIIAGVVAVISAIVKPKK
jgi:hypothetical protein